MRDYLDGKNLYGDDFSLEKINLWFNEESEGYANIENTDKLVNIYAYHELNKEHGFKKIIISESSKALGLGSAWGYEFEPIISKLSSLTIIEPSDKLVSSEIGNITPDYIKPNVDGSLKFSDSEFDVITCFGTLHHIPNVTYVLSELIRVLRPGGYLLVREPIVSMGDWNKKRIGLTKNERGIPVAYFENIFKNHSVNIISQNYCFTGTSYISRIFGEFFTKPIFIYKLYIIMDKHLSRLLSWNVKYHSSNKIKKIAPSSIFYVLQKKEL